MNLLDRIKNVFVPGKNNSEQRNISYTNAYTTGSTVTADTALTFTAVWSAVRLLSESVSSLPISIHKVEKNGDKTEAIKESLYNLLKYKPNTFQNKITFFEKIMMDLCINGNSYVLLKECLNLSTAVSLKLLSVDKTPDNKAPDLKNFEP